MYAKNIDQVEKIIPAVERIAHRHVARGVAPLQYDAVGECLLEAMRLVLKEAATDEFIAAWTEAYKFLAQTFIDMEEELKKTLEEKAGFSGMTTMTVSEMEDDDEGRILGLVPDDVDVPPHGKGQFLAILVHLGDEDTMTSMNIIDSDEACVRIRVPPSEEKATVALMKVVEGSKLTVSVPCGKVNA